MEWPWQYSFPPFFTLQINEDTKKKQLDAWCDLVLAYCKQTRSFQLDLIESQSSELFNNKKIDRKCSLELIAVIIDELVRRSEPNG
jgi:ESCRT-II complex subunit VPS25